MVAGVDTLVQGWLMSMVQYHLLGETVLQDAISVIQLSFSGLDLIYFLLFNIRNINIFPS